MSPLLLDSHVLHWWSAEPERLSPAAAEALGGADELAVSAVCWYELAWLAAHQRISPGRADQDLARRIEPRRPHRSHA
ncbi:MAG: PIN domain-containing protein [Mycobacteriales bacterium]